MNERDKVGAVLREEAVARGAAVRDDAVREGDALREKAVAYAAGAMARLTGAAPEEARASATEVTEAPPTQVAAQEPAPMTVAATPTTETSSV